jgi:ferredoxin
MPGALRVPCLNGLTLGRLLALAAETDGRPVALLDRGFCPGCPTGGGDSQPAGGLIAAAQALLGALGVPPSRHPHLIVLPLPAGRMQADLAGFVLEERVSRRGFLTALTARTAAAVEPLAEAGPALARSAEPLRHRAVPEDRQRLLAALRRLAPGARLPARLFPDLQAGPGCADHRVCAAACPTGALVGYDSGDGADPDGGGARGIRFDPAHCVACGLCVALCPTRSLNLTDRGTATADPTCTADPAAPRALTRHRPRTCSQCGVGYAGDDPLCPACGRDQALARSLFGTLFGTQSGARSDIAGGL